ncbi:hypothetical protein HO133_004071 [Letharia lupina]|uniref:tRNA(Phe) 7-[(3-amino-3-carboxypropyl)-4-demethylwyosine(37)-N(4)]-methyltransferase n=1 Tax=Letharia lupina TaxID=560253 RepID=A0A8H6C9U7_9LECA|nr:uncharacterized protein HO133_004071 [Letharia lupina]KAF6219602.1 hypothetical protein HO133_004071 [Letharia lupina]
MRQKAQVSPSFVAKKNAILALLSTPESTYTDLSPKGSVDAAIKPLIDRINALDGVVTTSSCAGRVTVFLEGRKQGKGYEERGPARNDGRFGKESEQAAVPGGKGMGGKWLFVSHEPVGIFKKDEGNENLTELLGLRSSGAQNEALALSGEANEMRLARFQFEPMILHIMTASLHRAQPILAAAINAGFRESGIQSLKNLDDRTAFPMVAIRTAGLAFESLVGLIPNRTQDREDGAEIEEHVTCIVSEEYLELLVNIANERFKTNAERIQRFEQDLFKREEGLGQAWEDSNCRQERKRAEGLEQQQTLRKAQVTQERGGPSPSDIDEGIDNAGLFSSSPPP